MIISFIQGIMLLTENLLSRNTTKKWWKQQQKQQPKNNSQLKGTNLVGGF